MAATYRRWGIPPRPEDPSIIGEGVPLRSGASAQEIGEFIAKIWSARIDRYSADRLAALNSSNYDPKSHRKIEMISLGG